MHGTGIPGHVTGGQVIYIRLWTMEGGAWRYVDSTYTVNAVAQFVNPTNGASNVDLTQPIQWTAINGAQAYYLYVGTTLGANDLINTGETQVTSWPATSLPAGVTLYARIWTKAANVWRSTDITFTASALRATMIAPANGAIGVDPAAALQWTNVPAAQKSYLLRGHDAGKQGPG